MAKAKFPSGPWVGFYTYSFSPLRHLMDLNLRFRGGRMEGDGADGINTFRIDGHYDEEKGECGWKKIYPTHVITYSGFRERKGIWGTWNQNKGRGGFQIWPLSEGGPPDLRKREVEEELEKVLVVPASPVRIE